jgi:biotin synthase-like enzyme
VPALSINFKCRFCPLSAQYEHTSKSICTHIRDEVVKKGIQAVTEEYVTKDSLLSYGAGGGRGHKNA